MGKGRDGRGWAGKLLEIEDVGEGIEVVIVLDPCGNRCGLIYYNPHFGK